MIDERERNDHLRPHPEEGDTVSALAMRNRCGASLEAGLAHVRGMT